MGFQQSRPTFMPASDEMRLEDARAGAAYVPENGPAARLPDSRLLMWHEIVNDVVDGRRSP